MAVVIPPPRRNLIPRLIKPVLLLAAISGLVIFFIYRFGDSPVEKAEKLFKKRELAELKSYTQKKIGKGEVNPLLFSYFAVADFSTNPKAKLGAILNNLSAVDDRPIFRRETLMRILEVSENERRAGEVLGEALKLETPPGKELKALIKNIFSSQIPLAAEENYFASLRTLFPEEVRSVAAKQLQFRSSPSTEGEVLRRLEDGETLLLRKSGAVTTVSGKTGKWACVLDANLTSGWVFDAYLKKVSE